MEVKAILKPATEAGAEGDSAAILRGFLRSAELAVLRMRGKASGRYFGAQHNDAYAVRWSISLDDSLTEMLPKQRPATPTDAAFGGGDGGNGNESDSMSDAGAEEDERDEAGGDDDGSGSGSLAAQGSSTFSGDFSNGNAKKRRIKPLHFDVRISPAASETMWRAWRQQRRVAVDMLDTKMGSLLRRAYDLKEFHDERNAYHV